MNRIDPDTYNYSSPQEIYCCDCGSQMYPDPKQPPFMGTDYLTVVPVICSGCKLSGSVLFDFNVTSFIT